MSDENDILLVLPADHVIKNSEAFTQTVNEAVPLANLERS